MLQGKCRAANSGIICSFLLVLVNNRAALLNELKVFPVDFRGENSTALTVATVLFGSTKMRGGTKKDNNNGSRQLPCGTPPQLS